MVEEEYIITTLSVTEERANLYKLIGDTSGSHVKVNAKGKMQAKLGFQAFVNIDEGGFIFATALTPGNKHEINSLTGLLDWSEDMLFAASAYSSLKIRN